MATGTVTTVLLAGGIVAVLGVLIKYFGMVNLIAGYDPETATDEEGLADFVGTNALYVAGLAFAVAAFEYTEPFDGYEIVWVVFLLGVGLLCFRMMRGTRRYESSP